MIHVLLFAELGEKAGKQEIEIPVEEMRISDLRIYLLNKFPKMTAINSAMPAINEEYAESEDIARVGDIVAFIPPVSGG